MSNKERKLAYTKVIHFTPYEDQGEKITQHITDVNLERLNAGEKPLKESEVLRQVFDAGLKEVAS